MKIEKLRFVHATYSDKGSAGTLVQRIKVKLDLDYQVLFNCFEYWSYFGEAYRGMYEYHITWENYDEFREVQERLIFDETHLIYEYHHHKKENHKWETLMAGMRGMIKEHLLKTLEPYGSPHVTGIQLSLFNSKDLEAAASGKAVKFNLTKFKKLMKILATMKKTLETI